MYTNYLIQTALRHFRTEYTILQIHGTDQGTQVHDGCKLHPAARVPIVVVTAIIRYTIMFLLAHHVRGVPGMLETLRKGDLVKRQPPRHEVVELLKLHPRAEGVSPGHDGRLFNEPFACPGADGEGRSR